MKSMHSDTSGPGRSKIAKAMRGGGKVHRVMSEFKHHTLHSGSKKGPKVTSRRQAIAIALSEAREAGEHVKKRRGKK